jgi:hypothetical protein
MAPSGSMSVRYCSAGIVFEPLATGCQCFVCVTRVRSITACEHETVSAVRTDTVLTSDEKVFRVSTAAVSRISSGFAAQP